LSSYPARYRERFCNRLADSWGKALPPLLVHRWMLELLVWE